MLNLAMILEECTGRPEAAAESIRKGWFHTGDVAQRDEDGYLGDILERELRTADPAAAPAEV